MTWAAGVNYAYDGEGQRVEKSSGKIYWYGAGTEILDESDTSGNFTNEYVFFGGKRVAMRTVSSGTIYYYEDDMLGSARTMVQAGQTSPCFDADFLPYGQEVDYTSACGSNYRFEGKERDLETGDDNFGARYYRSALGRWMSADWSSVPAPVPYANLTNPQTLNLYAMVSDNPETFADLDGHECNKNTIGPSDRNSCPGPAATKNAKPGEGFSPLPQKNGTNTPPQINNELAQQQNQQQKDDKQYHQALQQKEEQIREKQAGPPVGPPEYTKQLTNQVAKLTDSGEKTILAPAAAVEGVGVAVVAAPELGAAATTTVRAGTAYVLTHPDAPADFAQGLAKGPAGAPPTVAGAVGAVINVTLKSLIP